MSAHQDALGSGVPRLDTVLAGGLPAHQTMLFAGEPGTGKTVLATQIAFAAAQRGFPVVLATVAGEPHSKLLESIEAFSFFSRERVGKEVFIVSAYPWVRKGVREARDVLLSSVRERKARLLVIDGVRGVRDVWKDDSQVREFFGELSVGLATTECSALFTLDGPAAELMNTPEATLADGVVRLTVAARGAQRHRRLEVVKLRGRAHLAGEHAFRIDRSGISLTPRLESLRVLPTEVPSPQNRVGFGVAPLDSILSGGLPRGSATALAGTSGSGKSLLASHFVDAGAKLDEPGLFISFQELPQALLHRAAAIGLRLEEQVRRGMVLISHVPPVEIDPDAVAQDILETVREKRIKRVVIDSIGELERSVLEPDRQRGFMAALRSALQAEGVTLLFTIECGRTECEEMAFEQSPMASAADNLIFLWAPNVNSDDGHQLKVFKMRSSAHVHGPQSYRITDRGVKFESSEGRASR